MAADKNSILVKMLDRLFAGLASGPNLNCRPHSSRQRVDWTQFARLQDVSPVDALRQLLSDKQSTQLQGRVAPPKLVTKPVDAKKRSGASKTSGTKKSDPETPPAVESLSPEEQKQRDDWADQQGLLNKIRGLAADARDYEQDTGVHALHVGFPLLSLPPGAAGSLQSSSGGTKRLLAPIAFIPVSLELRAGVNPVISIEGLHDGADFLVPNEALFAWLERQTGQQLLPDPGLSAIAAATSAQAGSETADDESETESTRDAAVAEAPQATANASSIAANLDPWKELNDLVRRVSEVLHLPSQELTSETFTDLRSAPRTDNEDPRVEIVPAAVIGLFPMNKQGLLRDMQAMVTDPSLGGPVRSFLSIDGQLDSPLDERSRSETEHPSHVRPPPEAERLVTMADPFQARAVRLARDCSGLVIHGPPGTGKSQTITNIIGDHLVRGQRVLLVCDKRTALDVVARRLEHLGLGSLCALIHDPQHDQRNLYKQVREQLEALTGIRVKDRAQSQLQTLDQKLKKSQGQLADAWSIVMDRDATRGVSFHERMGEWLEAAIPVLAKHPNGQSNAITPIDDPQPEAGEQSTTGRAKRRRREKSVDSTPTIEPVSVIDYEIHADEIRDIITRATAVQYADHPWVRCAGISLPRFLQRSKAQIREDMAAIVSCCLAVDTMQNELVPPFALPAENELLDPNSASADAPSTVFLDQGKARHAIAGKLRQCLENTDAACRRRWATASKSSFERVCSRMKEAAVVVAAIRSEPLDAQFLMIARSAFVHDQSSNGDSRTKSTSAGAISTSDKLPSIIDIARGISDLDTYLHVSEQWYGWLAFSDRAKASKILRAFGLTRSVADAKRLRGFLTGLNARLMIGSLVQELSTEASSLAEMLDDETLLAEWDQLELLLGLLIEIRDQPMLADVSGKIRQALSEGDHSFAEGLAGSVPRAEALEELNSELVESELFRADWLREMLQRVCVGESITDEVRQLESSIDSLVDVLRIQSTLSQLPSGLRLLTERAILGRRDVDDAVDALRHQVLSDDIALWLKSNPQLQTLDGTRLNDLNRDVRRQLVEKQEIVRDRILDIWVGRQRERLLTGTGTRLNGAGADLRRRLTSRGERAMRLRQVISVGSRIEGGDPLFDLCPVWMASPETVAQIFPRDPLFDVVIFDEASQCRLEEALPVLMRARRVVIAGDPKQLPPSRFFESGVISSDNAIVETEQDLFEAHQREIEDLLTAALSLNIQECYLDVHYRSRNADLVEFSNENFYSSRLQSIPGHPKNRIRFAPITLYPVGGVFDERCNETEASQVCLIVADLLRRAEPPSIGIACFNLTQRDLILEKLDELAAEDREFGGRLSAARSRIGEGAFEGLFVKNLENVQGDERDHMIISTTYGPDKQGRFYRRFGPLGQAGGGRRLNVLVTRARDEVHLVTSIPSEIYRSLPPIPAGQQPGGGWLLFAYLAYAEQLAEHYSRCRDLESPERMPSGAVIELPSRTPSQFASAIARLAAARHHVGSDVHWGNDGFCVDVAFHHPSRPDDRTLGLLCDGTRFQNIDDVVAWELFRTAVLESQGWQIRRCWTPEFFRDPAGSIDQFVADAARIAEAEPDPEGIPVESD